MRAFTNSKLALGVGVSALAVSGCAGARSGGHTLPPATFVSSDDIASEKYVIGPLDQLNVFVWRNAELGANVQVRPDGRITTPLINEMIAAGKTPAQLADDIRSALVKYIDNPQVSVMAESLQKTFDQ